MSPEIFQQRRARVLSNMHEGIAIVYAHHLQTRSNDTEYRFRQNSNFHYLTGLNEEGAILLLMKNNKDYQSIIFVKEKDPAIEVWAGRRLGVTAAAAQLRVDRACDIKDFTKEVPKYLLGHSQVYLDFQHRPKALTEILNYIQQIPRALTKKQQVPQNIANLAPLLGRLRLEKSDCEIDAIKHALSITNRAHRAAMAKTQVAKNEYEVYALLEYIFKKEGADYSAYDPIVAGGDNANTLHYIENNQPLHAGDLLLIDAGCEYQLYASDITRTFPINGEFSSAQAAVYHWVLKAQEVAIAAALPGNTIDQLHKLASAVLVDGLLALGIMSGHKEKIIAEGSYRKYYPHGTCHWLGLDVHDQSPYLDGTCTEIKFAKGMVFTVEPGLYFSQDDLTIPAQYRGLGIRIEDNILITEQGHENLSAAIPKTIEGIEKACAENWQTFL